MKVTILFNWILTAIWAVSAVGLAIHHNQRNATAEISQDKRELLPRAGPGGLELRIVSGQRPASFQRPSWEGTQPYSDKTTAEIQAIARNGYDYTRFCTHQDGFARTRVEGERGACRRQEHFLQVIAASSVPSRLTHCCSHCKQKLRCVTSNLRTVSGT